MAVAAYHFSDRATKILAPGTVDWMYDSPGVKTNIIGPGLVGTYSFTLHLGGNGNSGDGVFYTIVRQNGSGPLSTHYLQNAEIVRGSLADNVEYKLTVTAGDKIFVRVSAYAGNSTSVVVSLIDSDAYNIS